jgi:hypothetical protein
MVRTTGERRDPVSAARRWLLVVAIAVGVVSMHHLVTIHECDHHLESDATSEHHAADHHSTAVVGPPGLGDKRSSSDWGVVRGDDHQCPPGHDGHHLCQAVMANTAWSTPLAAVATIAADAATLRLMTDVDRLPGARDPPTHGGRLSLLGVWRC